MRAVLSGLSQDMIGLQQRNVDGSINLVYDVGCVTPSSAGPALLPVAVLLVL